ncbi:hypothetical protein AAFF_G00180470 [Aldrovandia affinis]|uniref:Uncharacterized protein n=1 Tax=Aldrovandia affinis TaxID=143900 RepID=A0AAD7WVQ4_9TELE|nr:hypothetical protein AAFF_G00180470 [Aldrovandia affinis]
MCFVIISVSEIDPMDQFFRQLFTIEAPEKESRLTLCLQILLTSYTNVSHSLFQLNQSELSITLSTGALLEPSAVHMNKGGSLCTPLSTMARAELGSVVLR